MATRSTRTKSTPRPARTRATRTVRRTATRAPQRGANIGKMIAFGSLIGVGVLAALGVSALLLVTEVPELKPYRRYIPRYIPRDLARRIPQWAHEGREALEPVGDRIAEAGDQLRERVRSAFDR
ncbi:MAG TPA: hypothetical protein VHW02_15455 [Rhizomicrobium sp.]|nr:hypothetical protein [Rhizomicrobium sp.]